MSIFDAINAMNEDNSRRSEPAPGADESTGTGDDVPRDWCGTKPPVLDEPDEEAEFQDSVPQADPHSSNQEAVDAILAAFETRDPNALIKAMTGMVETGEEHPSTDK